MWEALNKYFLNEWLNIELIFNGARQPHTLYHMSSICWSNMSEVFHFNIVWNSNSLSCHSTFRIICIIYIFNLILYCILAGEKIKKTLMLLLSHILLHSHNIELCGVFWMSLGIWTSYIKYLNIVKDLYSENY